jgi:ribosome-associated translation inhibitor RaiA
MKIQINTDKTISGDEMLQATIESQINDEFSRYQSDISRIEVHLSDENGKKEGINDRRCLLEARIEGKQPVAVSCQAATTSQALTGAIGKLKASLDTIIGRSRNH